MSNEASSSFEIKTFNQKEGVLYFVDEVKDGLKIENDCRFPCETCASTNPGYCESCDLSTPLKYLELGACVKKCSLGTFLEKQANG